MTALALLVFWAAPAHTQTIPVDDQPDLLVGTGPGQSRVRLLNGADGSELISGFPWGAGNTSGARVAAGDVTGDGVADLFVGSGPGDGLVSIFNGATASPIITFAPFGFHFRGGVHMATGDFDGDGRADLIVGGGRGSGRVRIYSSATFQQILTDFPFGTDYTGGVTVGAGDVNGDGRVDAIVGQETGGIVRVFDGATPTILASGAPYGSEFTGGVYVAAGDVDGDGNAEVITGQRSGGRAVLVIDALTMQIVTGFTPFGGGDGVSVAAGDLNGDGLADLVVGTGPGTTPRARVLRGPDGLELLSGLVFDADFLGGVFVATTAEASTLRFTSEEAATFEVGVSGTFTITTVGPARPITMTGTLPSGVTFTDNGDGTAVLQGTPAAGTGGAHTLTFIAAAGTPLEADQAFTLTVNEAPAITSAAATTFPLGAPGTFTVTTTGFPVPTIAIGGAALPSGVTFTDNGDGTATLAGTPAPGTGGTYALTFTAANTVGTDATQAFTLTVEGAPVFTSAASTTFQVGVPGTFAITATATPPVTAMTIGGTALPAGLAFVDNGSGSATLSGTPAPGTGGIYTLTFTATNGVHTPTVQNFTLTVNEPPAITSAASATFPLGAISTFTVTTSGFPLPALTVSDTLPAGVAFVDNGNGTGTLSGTPTAGGVFPLTLTASNSIGADAVQAFTLTVDSSPGFSSPPATTFQVGVPGTFSITTVGVPAVNSITLGGDPLPAGLAFVDHLDGTANLAGTPATGTGGTYALTFTASNGVHAPVVQNFTLTITQPPAVTSAASTTFTVGTPGTFTMTTTGFPAPSLTLTGTLPTGVTFADNGNGTATLAGTPAAGTGGTHDFTVTATNGIGTDAGQSFTLNVSEAPTITSAATTSFAVGAAGTFTVTTSSFPAAALSVTGTLPSGVTFVDNGTGTATLSGIPAAGTGGAYPLTITAANGIVPDAVQAFVLNVSEGPAITSAPSVNFTVGAMGSFTVTTSGSPAPTLVLGGAALPSGVNFVDNGNGTAALSGIPAPGTGGTYALTFTASNGVGTDAVQNFTLTVNQAPAFTSPPATTFQVGQPGSFTITTSGFPAVALITRGGVALPSGVTYTDNGNGTATLSGTPATGTGGDYALTFTINNGVGGAVVQDFTLSVQAPPAVTSATSTSFTVGTPGTFTVTATGFPAPTLSQSGALPAGVTFTPATRVLAGTATQTGAFPLVFTATNGIVPDATQNFTLNVVCPAITVNPAALPDGLFETAYGPVSLTQTGSTGTTFTWGATGLPAGLALSTAGVLSGTPTTTVVGAAISVTVTDNFGCTGTRNTTITIRPVADNESYLNGVGHTQFVVGAAQPLTPHVFVSDTVLAGDNGPGSLNASLATGPANGAVTLAGNGTFVYTPNVNFAGPTDSFTYTLTDGNGVTNTGTVTIALSNIVWYVNSAAGAGGDGRSHSPFNSLASVGTPSTSTHYIYVHTGGATTPGDLTLDPAQTLHGQGAAFALGALSLPAGTRPTLSGTVTLANNTVVRAVNFSGAATALSLPAGPYTSPVVIDQVTVTGGTTGLQVGAATGIAPAGLTVSNAQFTNLSGAEVSLNGGNLPVTFPATTTISSSTGASISIQNRTGGTVTFAGPISVTGGTGISLTTNPGSTIAFSGGLALSTGANPAFAATGGGTVTATQNNSTIVNTITTTTGVGLNVSNTTIGAANLVFRSINVNGAPNGVVLNNAGGGGLTVTGNSAGTCGGQVSNNGATVTAPVAADCTGGSLSTTGAAFSLTNSGVVSLTRVRVAGTGDDGIAGSGVAGLILSSCLIENAGNAVGERGIDLTNLGGIGGISNSTVRGSAEHNVVINNTAATLISFSITASQFSANSIVTGDDGILLLTDGAGNITASITQSAFTDNKGDHFQAATTASATGSITVTFSGNTLVTTPANDPNVIGGGITISPSGSADLTFTISNNNIQQAFDDAINLNLGTASTAAASMVGSISNNTIGTSGSVDSGSESSNTITVTSNGFGTTTVAVINNVLRQYGNGSGIHLDNKEGSSTLNATVTGNTIEQPGSFALNGIHLNAGATAGPPADAGVTCAAISGNTVINGGLGTADVRLRQRFNTTVRLPGYAGGSSDTTAVNAFVSGNNGGAEVTSIHNVGGGGLGFVGGAACPTP